MVVPLDGIAPPLVALGLDFVDGAIGARLLVPRGRPPSKPSCGRQSKPPKLRIGAMESGGDGGDDGCYKVTPFMVSGLPFYS